MEQNKSKYKDAAGSLFIPAGVLMGLGFGFVFNNLPAGIFIGLGGGFLLFALTVLMKKNP